MAHKWQQHAPSTPDRCWFGVATVVMPPASATAKVEKCDTTNVHMHCAPWTVPTHGDISSGGDE